MGDEGQADAIIIRDAKAEELAEIGDVIRAAYEQYRVHYNEESWQRLYRALGDVEHHFEQGEVIVAELEGRVVGTITLYADGARAGQGDWPADWALLVRLAVLPEMRGRGISRLLMEEAIRRCRERGIKTVGLHTTEWMAVGRAMYERMGFVPVPEYDFHPPSGIVAHGFKLDL